MTLSCACLHQHQVADYVKPVGIMLRLYASSDNDSWSLEREICPFVLNPALADRRSCTRSLWKGALRRTTTEYVATLSKLPGIWWKSHISRGSCTSWVSEWSQTLSEAKKNKKKPKNECFSLLFRHCNVTIFDRMLISDKKFDTPKRTKHLSSSRNSVLYQKKQKTNKKHLYTHAKLFGDKFVRCCTMCCYQCGQPIIVDMYSQQLDRVQQALK